MEDRTSMIFDLMHLSQGASFDLISKWIQDHCDSNNIISDRGIASSVSLLCCDWSLDRIELTAEEVGLLRSGPSGGH